MTKKKNEKEEVFNWETSLEAMEEPEALKAGFQYYIINNNIPVKSENDLTKQYEKFKELNIGV